MMSVDLAGDLSQQGNQIVRPITFRAIAALLLANANHGGDGPKLNAEQQRHYLHALNLAVDNVKLLINTQYVRILPELLDQEFDAAMAEDICEDKFLRQLKSLMMNPLIMLEQINEKTINRRVPPELLQSTKMKDLVSIKLRVVLTVRKILATLGVAPALSVNPMKR